MSFEAVLNDLRAIFGPAKSVLYAADIAQILGKSVSAVYSLKADGGLPFPVIEVGGRPAVSIYEAAGVLSGQQPPASKPAPPNPTAAPAIKTKRPRPDLGALRRSAALAFDFFSELDAALERIELDDAALETEQTSADLGRESQPR